MTGLSIKKNHSLKDLNTLAIDQSASFFVAVRSVADVEAAVNYANINKLPFFVMGGGSNLVLSKDYDGLVIHIGLKGISIVDHGDSDVIVRAAAGENWHQLVQYCLREGYAGVENLALIPGTAGAAPVQNIGAYGVELSDVLSSVDAWDTVTGRLVTFDKEGCHFSYRDSIFKQCPGRYIICSISLRLHKSNRVQIQYQALRQYLQQHMGENGLSKVLPQQVYDAVVSIRQSKLPDPSCLPNVGSFFKNPLVSNKVYLELLQRYPSLVSFPAPNGQMKLAAGWLIEQAGWKGQRQGPAGVHDRQALVLVNLQHAGGKDILSLAERIRLDVNNKFGVWLEIEPVVL